jgi:DNA-binding NarL/FixJ family response regulator
MNLEARIRSVLVVEDDDRHFAAIRKALEQIDRCSVDRIATDDVEELYNYKTSHPESQVAVIDLSLGTYVPKKYEGLKVIRFLEHADKTTFYVVFSQWPMPEEMSVERPNPHWTFVKKEIDGGVPSSDSLESLARAVKMFVTWSSPLMVEPRYDALS